VTRTRRWLPWLLGAPLALVLLAALAWPFAVRAVLARELPKDWGAPARIGSAEWFLGRRLVLRDVVSEPRPGDATAIAVARIELEFERRLLADDPGRLVAGDFVGGTLRHEGRDVASVEHVRYRWDPVLGADLAIDGVDGVFDTSRPGDWIAVIRRIVEAPGIGGDDGTAAAGDARPAAATSNGGDGGGDRLRTIEVANGRLAVRLSIGRDAPATLPLDPFACTLRPTASQSLAIERLSARLFGGELAAHGDVDWSRAAVSWHAQANLQQLDLAAAGAARAWVPTSSTGRVSAFADLGTTGDGALGGAGWVEGTRVAVWELPEAKAVLDELGVAPRRDDVLDEVRAHLLVDRDRLWIEQLVALGEPVNLFGNGSLRLDGGELRVGLVPRFRDKTLADIPLAQRRARDTALDVLKGALVEVRVEGGVDGIRTFVQPVPAVTEPLRRFLALFR
jgi:hypothetical protein